MEAGMSRINYTRVALGALAASLILFLGQLAVIGTLSSRLLAARAAANLPPVEPRPILSILELVISGFLLVWVYAAIRPRFGLGPATAVRAGLVVWACSPLLTMIHMIYDGFGFPPSILLIVAGSVLPVFVAASLLGAWVYAE
jgi:hypothetical protein